VIIELLNRYAEAKERRDSVKYELTLVAKGSEMHRILTGRFELADREYQSAKRDLNNAVQPEPMARQIVEYMFKNNGKAA
jgi:hypothetical protein